MATQTVARQRETGTPTAASGAGWATYPALAAGAGGTLWVAWLERLDGADAIWLRPAGGAAGEGPRLLTRAAAIKDGPALAWTARDGLCCAWQYRDGGCWRLALLTGADGPPGRPVAHLDLGPPGDAGGPARPSHP